MIHKIKSPFMCREGQFTPGKRDLCFGVSEKVLKATKTHEIELSHKRYEIDCEEALKLAEETNSYSQGRGGRVAIVPLKICKLLDEPEYFAPVEQKEIRLF